jgi:hypothetical protein
MIAIFRNTRAQLKTSKSGLTVAVIFDPNFAEALRQTFSLNLPSESSKPRYVENPQSKIYCWK